MSDINKILKKTADYIACTQPIVDEYNGYKEAVVKEAHETIGALVAVGIVSEEKKAEAVSQLIDNPIRAFGLIRGMADTLVKVSNEKKAANSLGWVSDEPAKLNDLDPVERWALYGDHRITKQPRNF